MQHLLQRPLFFTIAVVLGTVLVMGLLHPLLESEAARRTQLKLGNSRSKKEVFRATNVRPGAVGLGKVTITNTSKIPAQVALSQTAVTKTGLERALLLSITDDTTKVCIYPKVKTSRNFKHRGCPAMATWTAGAKLRNTLVTNRKGALAWSRKEKHTFTVRWKLAPTSTNADQGKTAAFSLIWRAK